MATVTIHDIAHEAGVCIGTVSRVINNKDRVRRQTRERIQLIIEKTGYRPSAIGRALVLRRTKTIMLLLHNIADPHCVDLAKHVSRLCRKEGYKMVVGDADYQPSVEAEALEVVRDGSVDGLLVSRVPGRRNLPLYRKLADSGFPMVAIMDPVPGTAIPCVKYDDIAAGRLATDYLLDNGHREVIFVSWHTEFPTVKQRYDAYVDSLTARSLAVRPELHVQLPHSLDSVKGLLAEALSLKPAPTAILAVNEMVALACLNALSKLHRRVPEDISVMVFGNQIPEGAAALPMTAVELSERALGERAVQILLGRIEQSGQPGPEPTLLETLQPRLVVGASTRGPNRGN